MTIRARRPWTAADDAELARLWPDHTYQEIAEMMGRRPYAVTSRAAKLRLRKSPARRVVWTDAMAAVLTERYPHEKTAAIAADLGLPEKALYTKAARLGLKKSAQMREQLAREAADALTKSGGRTQFKAGQAAWNRGKNYQPGGRSVETRFKKGQLNGQAALNYKPIGTLRISKDGYLERKTTDDHPVPARRWTAVHRLVWEDARGPIPPKHTVRFKPGCFTTDPDLITADKLECISMAENMRRNSVHSLPEPLPQIAQLRGALRRKINNRRKKRG